LHVLKKILEFQLQLLRLLAMITLKILLMY
jgi:hypothetical protein